MAKAWTSKDIPPLSGKHAIVTGANRGLGLQIARALARAGATLTLAARDPDKAQAAVKVIRGEAPNASVALLPLDLGDLASVRRFADDIKGRADRIHLMIHNASAILVPQGKTRDGFETHFGTNHLGPFALTGLLIDRIRATPGARIVSTGSSAHRMVKGLDFSDLNFERTAYKPMEAYGRSKLAALLFNFELARRLKAAGADTLAVAAHPGYSNSNPGTGAFGMRIAAALFAQPAAMGALPTLYAATAAGVVNGGYYGPGGAGQMRGYPVKVEAARTASDAASAAHLWELSETLTGVRYLGS